ncbi:MAG TPA: hypothetical protein PKM59_01995 [Thermodesulfobacteriota bacterium]|nr:hypothetical protein [Thermodesulfobacteriota bacterium]HNU70585.1 hypothetical protein [Thermodesulfobacteriota bacterium]
MIGNSNTVTLEFKVKDDGSIEVLGGKVNEFGEHSQSTASKAKSAFDTMKASWMQLVAAAYAIKEIIDIYMDHDRATRAMQTTFGQAANDYIAQAQKISDASRNMFHVDEIMSSMATYATAMKRYGIEGEQYIDLISRATDVAAGKNIDLESSMSRITSAMRGEAESAEFLGLTLNDNYMKQMAFGGALQATWEQMSDSEKAHFRYLEMMNQTAEYTGKAGETAQSFEGQLKILWNTVKDLLIPILSNFLIPWLQKVADVLLFVSNVITMDVGAALAWLLDKIATTLTYLEKLPKIGKYFDGMAEEVRVVAQEMDAMGQKGAEGLMKIVNTQEKKVTPAVQQTINVEQELAKVTKDVSDRNTKEKEKQAEKIRALEDALLDDIQKNRLDEFGYARWAIDEEYKAKQNQVNDKKLLDEWYLGEKKKIDDAELKATEEKAEEQRKIEEQLTDKINELSLDQYEYAEQKLEEEVEAFREAGIDEAKIKEYYSLQMMEIDKARSDAAKEQLEAEQKAFEEAAEKEKEMVETVSDEIVGVGSDLENWHENLWDRIVGYGLKKAAEYAAGVAIQLAKMMSVSSSSLASIFSAIGVPVGGSSTGGVPGVSGESSSGGISSIPGIGSMGSFYLPSSMGGWEIGLGELGVAAVAGNYLPQLWGGEGGLPSSLGATAGYVGGTALLGTSFGAAVTSAATAAFGATLGSFAMPVLGTIAGAVIGEIVGGLFDDSHDEAVRDRRGAVWSQAFTDMMYYVTNPEEGRSPLSYTQQAGWYSNGQYLPFELQPDDSQAKLQYAGWAHTVLHDQMSEEDYIATLAQWDNITAAVANSLDARGLATAQTAEELAKFAPVIELTGQLMVNWGADAQAAGQAFIEFYGALTAASIDDWFTKAAQGASTLEEAMANLHALGMTPAEEATITYNLALDKLLNEVERGSGDMMFWYDLLVQSRGSLEDIEFWTAELNNAVTLLTTAEDLNAGQVASLIMYYRDLEAALDGDTEAQKRLEWETEYIAELFADYVPSALELYIDALKSAETQTNLTASAISAGFSAGFQAATAEEGWAAFEQAIYQSIYDTIEQSVIDAFIQSEVYKSALAPFTETIGTAMEEAWATGIFDPAVFSSIMQPALSQTMTNIEALEPAFTDIYAMTAQIRTNLGLDGTGDETTSGGVLDTEAWEDVITDAETLSANSEEIMSYLGGIRDELIAINAISFDDKELRINVVPYLDGEAVTLEGLTDAIVDKIRVRSENGEIILAEAA